MEHRVGSIGELKNAHYQPLSNEELNKENNVQNEAGTYIKTDFGWIFVKPQDMIQGTNINSYEQVVNNNITNLAQSDKQVRGRVTIDMIQEFSKDNEEEYNPVLNNDDEENKIPEEVNPKKKNKKKSKMAMLSCCGVGWVIFLYFFLDHIIQCLQYIGIAINLSSSWYDSIHDFLKGLDVFGFNLENYLYIACVIACILLMGSYALFVALATCDLVDLECCDNCEEFLSLIFFEYFFFGFFCIPILKMLMQTYDCIDVDGEMVLRRQTEWKCGSWYQILLFAFSVLTIIFLIIGAIVRNLAREEISHFKTNELRIKHGIKYLNLKEVSLKMIIVGISVFGPAKQYWPNIICFFMYSAVTYYWYYIMPYVIVKYNHVKNASNCVSCYCFFASIIANFGRIAPAFKGIGSVMLFLFPIAGVVGYYSSTIRGKYVQYDEKEMEERELLKKVFDKDSYQDKAKIINLILEKQLIGIKVTSIKRIDQNEHMIYGKCKILEGEFRISGEEGMVNLCIVLGILSNLMDQPKMFFSKLVIRADKEDQATEIKFALKSGEAFVEAYFAGCFRVLTHLQINHFKFDHFQAIKITGFFVDSPILKVLNFSNNQLDNKVVKGIIKKVYNNEAIEVIDISGNYIYSEDQLQIQSEYNYHPEKTIVFI